MTVFQRRIAYCTRSLPYLSIYLPIVFVYTFSNSSLFCFTLQRYSSQRAEGTSSPVCATFLVLFLFFILFLSLVEFSVYLSRPSFSLSHSRIFSCISTILSLFLFPTISWWNQVDPRKNRKTYLKYS